MNSEKSIKTEKSLREKLLSGDRQAISDCIDCENRLSVVYALCGVIKYKIDTPQIRRALEKHRNDGSFEFCVRVSWLAIAALDVLGIEKYTGDDEQIKEIIEDQFAWVKV